MKIKMIFHRCRLISRLPISNIGNILKKYLSKDIKISNGAKELVSECLYEFILFIVSESEEKCKLEKRKTLDGEDVLESFKNLGFDDYYTLLKNYSQKYKAVQKSINEEVNKQIN